jgi:glutaredoxin
VARIPGPGEERLVILYTKPGCPLCHEVHAAVQPLVTSLGARLTAIDVRADPGLMERYGQTVPVVAVGPVLVAAGHWTPRAARRLRRLLTQRRSRG